MCTHMSNKITTPSTKGVRSIRHLSEPLLCLHQRRLCLRRERLVVCEHAALGLRQLEVPREAGQRGVDRVRIRPRDLLGALRALPD